MQRKIRVVFNEWIKICIQYEDSTTYTAQGEDLSMYFAQVWNAWKETELGKWACSKCMPELNHSERVLLFTKEYTASSFNNIQLSITGNLTEEEYTEYLLWFRETQGDPLDES